MMDHVTGHSQDEDKRSGSKPSGVVNESDDSTQGSYYYDDSSNYEVYQDDDDEADDSPVSEPSADSRA
jgi:hypothetical protein